MLNPCLDSLIYTKIEATKKESGVPVKIKAKPFYNGILSCFFQGFSNFFSLKILNALETFILVVLGKIISSMYPLEAAI